MDIQTHFEQVINGLGSYEDWGQAELSAFHDQFFAHPSVEDGRLRMKVDKVIPRANNKLLVVEVINPESSDALRNPVMNDTWTIGVPHKVNAPFEVGDFVIGHGRIEKNVSYRRNMIKVDGHSLVKVTVDEAFTLRYGKRFTNRLLDAFGSLSDIAPLVINEYQNEVHNELEEWRRHLDEQKQAYEAKLERAEAATEEALKKQAKIHEEKKSEFNSISQELVKEKKRINSRKARLQKNKQLLEDQEKELLQRQRDLEEEEAKFDEQFRYSRLVNPFVKPADPSDEEPVDSVAWSAQSDVADAIRGALYARFQLMYEKQIIDRFIAALKADMIVILNGPSGTGKSSLVDHFTKVIRGAKTRTVRVQSSWSDSQDLMGFFNPLDYQYIPTPFLEALLEAGDDPDHLYLINLDEMNLAHVEYYFADILSAREDHERVVMLYAKHFESLAERTIDEFVIRDKQGHTSLDQERLRALSSSERLFIQNCFDLCFTYPSRIRIPPNVRFVGTLNMDQTVKGLSPKVIDRSFVITLDFPEDDEKLIEELEQLALDQVLSLDVEKDLASEPDEAMKEWAKGLNPMLEQLNARLNQRALSHIADYAGAAGTAFTKNDITHGKILPRINVVQDDSSSASFKRLNRELSDDLSKQTKEKMERMMKEGKMITYWR